MSMYMSAGHVYVYRSYGIHYCVNVVTGEKGRGEAVLLRSVEIDIGVELARIRRGNAFYRDLSNGPGKVCQAFGITMFDDALELGKSRLWLEQPSKHYDVLALPRIGISKDAHRMWRFVAH